MLNDKGQGFVVNDSYFLQILSELTDPDYPKPEDLAAFDRNCRKRILERAVVDDDITIDRSLSVSRAFEKKADAGQQALSTASSWSDVLADLIADADDGRGSKCWGWNTPQDYTQIHHIREHFPDARFIFLVRNPFDMLKSYKNIPDYWGAEKNRYHPILQAIVWRNVIRVFDRFTEDNKIPVMLVKYEDLVSRYKEEEVRIREFIGVDLVFPDPRELKNNSSMKERAPRILSVIERMILSAVCRRDLDRLGYTWKQEKVSAPLGVLEFIKTSFVCFNFYARTMLFSRDMRRRVRLLVGATFRT
jgi:hypothetical protein